MDKALFKAVTVGDIIRHKTKSESMVIVADYGDRKTAVRVLEISNPSEWDLIYQAEYNKDGKVECCLKERHPKCCQLHYAEYLSKNKS